MNLSFRRFSFSLLLVAIGFFPYMPLAHAGEEAPHPQHYGCEPVQQGGHEMDLCIQAVHDILSGAQTDVPVIVPVPLYIFPFWEDVPEAIETRTVPYLSHTLDPPSWSGHHLVGIVRILV